MQQGLDQDFDIEHQTPIALVAEIGINAALHGINFSGFSPLTGCSAEQQKAVELF